MKKKQKSESLGQGFEPWISQCHTGWLEGRLSRDPTANSLAVPRSVSYTGPYKNKLLDIPGSVSRHGVLLELPSCSMILYEN